MKRAIRALIRKTFGKNHSMKSQASVVTLVCCLVFLASVICFFASLGRYFWGREKGPDLSENVIIVNAPSSWKSYVKEEARFLDKHLVYRRWDAYFDIFTFSDWMKEEEACMVVVFPKDFTKKCKDIKVEDMPDILTYCDPDHLEYVIMKDEFCKEYIQEGYYTYLQEKLGIPMPEKDIPMIWMDGEAQAEWKDVAADRFAHMVMPLLFFIGIMYVCMLTGMNAIAGEKERGTFASLLMTPVSRMTIVLGNYLGVVLHAVIPVLVLFLPLLFFVLHFGLLGVLLLSLSLVLLISGITILISCMSNTIVSAQTAFLPIFLIVLVACVTCMQSATVNPVNYYIPIYGHFYGIGDCLMGTENVPALFVCALSSVLLAGVCVLVSRRLLMTEAFTVAVETKSEKELRKAAERAKKEQHDYVSSARAHVFGYRPTRRSPAYRFLIRHAVLPLALLSVFQTLAMIPAIISYMKTPESTAFFRMFRELSDLTQITDAVTASAELFSEFMANRYFILFMGIGYWCIIGIYMLLVRFRDRQSLATMGLTSGKELVEKGHRPPFAAYLKGLLLGFLLISSVYVLLFMTGQITCRGWALKGEDVVLFILYVLMWIPQGATEEIMMRGYMMPRVAGRFGVPFAVFFSSLCFSIMHAGNAGFSILAFINLMLIAALFACIALRSGHIWTVCAMHTMWNFCQGNVFGLEVSGNPQSASLLSTGPTFKASDLMSGGSFGPEGGLCVTIVIVIAFAVILATKKKEPKA